MVGFNDCLGQKDGLSCGFSSLCDCVIKQLSITTGITVFFCDEKWNAHFFSLKLTAIKSFQYQNQEIFSS